MHHTLPRLRYKKHFDDPLPNMWLGEPPMSPLSSGLALSRPRFSGSSMRGAAAFRDAGCVARACRCRSQCRIRTVSVSVRGAHRQSPRTAQPNQSPRRRAEGSSANVSGRARNERRSARLLWRKRDDLAAPETESKPRLGVQRNGNGNEKAASGEAACRAEPSATKLLG